MGSSNCGGLPTEFEEGGHGMGARGELRGAACAVTQGGRHTRVSASDILHHSDLRTRGVADRLRAQRACIWGARSSRRVSCFAGMGRWRVYSAGSGLCIVGGGWQGAREEITNRKWRTCTTFLSCGPFFGIEHVGEVQASAGKSPWVAIPTIFKGGARAV